ncbi:MAG: hypothetical protein H7061_07315 [Bdellovibrionaceae bacterium]|nr:hypothetical protein [Bdellovibrio sp.]
MKKLTVIKIFTILALQLSYLPSVFADDAFKLGDQAITRCDDWSFPRTFEQSVEEYMGAIAERDPDFGCVSRAAWMATEDLFRIENSARYDGRLKAFEIAYKDKAKLNLQTRKAYEDLEILFQFRWLSVNYEAMRSYKASKVVTGVAAATSVSLAVVGAGLILKTPGLGKLSSTARPALIRMLKYLGPMMVAQVAMSGSTSEKLKALAGFSKPPLDLIGGTDITFWNYSDLHLMRDIATVTAEAIATGAAQAGITIMALRLGIGVATAGKFFGASSLIGLAASYPIGKLVGYLANNAITEKYHEIHSNETVKMETDFNQENLKDWQRNILAAKLTNSAVTWVSTQDLYLQTSIEEKIEDFARSQVCLRLTQHISADIAEKNQMWQGQSGRTKVDYHAVGIESLNKMFDRDEVKLHTKVYQEIVDKQDRLMQVREGILKRMIILENLKKPYLRDYVIQHQVLIDRLDRYLNHDGVIDADLNELRAVRSNLQVNSPKWKDEKYLEEIRAQYGCFSNK